MKEQWKDIKGYEGLYQVSNLGNVKSFNRYKNGIILKKHRNKNSFSIVTLCNNLETKNYTIHRLVAEYFLDDYNDKLEVHFKNGDKSNCSVSNLYMSKDDNSHNPMRKLYKYDLSKYEVEIKNNHVYIKEL